MTPEEAAAAYLADCKARGLSPNSLQTYRYALKSLVPRLPQRDLSSISSAEISAAWLAFVAAPTPGANTKRLYRVACSIWLNWCVSEAGLAEHALRKAPQPKRTAPRRPKVTVSHLEAMRAACEKLKTEYERSRARAMLEVGWSTLLRRNELLALRLEHLDLSGETPRLKVESGKGGWSGWLPISDDCAATLRAWLLVRGTPDHNYLWCYRGRRRIPLGTPSWSRLLTRLAGIAGIDASSCKPHGVRRGSATAMLQAGVDVGTVSSYLRHATIQTTWMYVEASASRLSAVRNWMAPASVSLARPDPAQPRRRAARPSLITRGLRVHYRGAASTMGDF